ncbi:MAG: hypothetical protein DRN78_06410 [Thermoproteota archaeon]|nr:MAG: hypothetical protein DRN78_06410 [Candidatus Korarchaeota archaeon]
MDVFIIKALVGALFGLILAPLTYVVNMFMHHPFSDILLLTLFFSFYFISQPLSSILIRKFLTRESEVLEALRLTKGITVFYSAEFIFWVAIYELMSYFFH